MTRKLDVYLHQNLIGCLSIDSQGDMAFSYTSSYASNKQNLVLSQSLPLQTKTFDAKQCRPFFSGILPEAHLRASIARQLGISEKNDFSLLSAIGGECAGAVSLLPSSVTPENLKPEYRTLDEQALTNILDTMHQKPMLVGEDGIRLSLAGAQDKLAVSCINQQIAIPINGAPSTHILKPVNRDFLTLIENECFCLNLAKKVGLNTAEAVLHYANHQPYLLIKRYDRVQTHQNIQRLHQEDFCQALGIIPEMKYQREGGPDLASCFQLIRNVSTLPVLDIKALLHGVLFNLIIGNNDAHGKNFSLLYDQQHTRLAPFYDLISTVYYPELATKMAMKIGSKYNFDVLYPRHIMQMADEAGLSKALVRKETMNMIKKIQTHLTESPFTSTIQKRAATLLHRLSLAQ
ncbi:MAG: type II toxin-antitoxin system HipA family toxin [Legionellaceae bacterium]|nr:type II toxin-antitoxin system HipA family toxin [Legionellaceae bacterium]